MNSIFFNQKTPNEIAKILADKIKAQRNLDKDIENIFTTKTYTSIDEIINEEAKR